MVTGKMTAKCLILSGILALYALLNYQAFLQKDIAAEYKLFSTYKKLIWGDTVRLAKAYFVRSPDVPGNEEGVAHNSYTDFMTMLLRQAEQQTGAKSSLLYSFIDTDVNPVVILNRIDEHLDYLDTHYWNLYGINIPFKISFDVLNRPYNAHIHSLSEWLQLIYSTLVFFLFLTFERTRNKEIQEIIEDRNYRDIYSHPLNNFVYKDRFPSNSRFIGLIGYRCLFVRIFYLMVGIFFLAIVGNASLIYQLTLHPFTMPSLFIGLYLFSLLFSGIKFIKNEYSLMQIKC